MPAADSAWLHMDSATNPMVVNAVGRLGGVPDFERLAGVIEERMVGRFPRFRQRVADRLGRAPQFEDDPFFELGNHLQRLALPAPGDRGALESLVGDLITPPLDPGKPLWHAYLIEGFDGGAALLWRIHHCIADGIALGRVMLSVADGPGAERFEPPPPEPEHERGALGRLAAAPGGGVSAGRGVAGAAVHESTAALAHPAHLRELASGALRDASTVAKLLASPADAPTALRGPLSGTRRVAWSDPFPLDTVKDSCHRRRVTVNDLLLTALAATFAGHLGDGEPPEEIHAMIPVNLRPLDQPVPARLGNDFALVLLELPVGELRPAERLRRVNAGMEELKRSHEAPISFGLLNAMGMTPPWVEERLIGFFTDKASMVVTNVPGPRERLHLAGVPIDGVLVWAPCSGSLGLTVSIFSYAGEVSAGFMADTALIADPEPLARGYERELARLL
jgi:WS/DGAT/MGAT family acyltransferase